MYKVVHLDRDSPCIQSGLLSLALCMPNIRAAAAIGDIICGVESTATGSFHPKVLFVAEINKIVDCKEYYWWMNKYQHRNKYRSRRDCVYSVFDDEKRWSIHGMHRKQIQEYIYLYTRVKQNLNPPKLDRKITLSSNYKSFFACDGPKISSTFEMAILQHRRSIYVANNYVKEEIMEILHSTKYKPERDANGFNTQNPKSYQQVRRMVDDKQYFRLYEKPYTMTDIVKYIKKIGGIPFNAKRDNAKKKKDKGKKVRSVSLGALTMMGTNYRYFKTFEPSFFKLFLMVVKYGRTKWNLKLDIDYGSICINENFECGEHKDQYNKGISYVVGGGQYTGGELVIEGKEYNIRNQLVHVKPSQKHWVNPFKGHRISIVFFTSSGHDI